MDFLESDSYCLLVLDCLKSIGQIRPIFTLFVVRTFSRNFCRFDESFTNIRENSRGVGVSTVSGISAAACFTVFACVIDVK